MYASIKDLFGYIAEGKIILSEYGKVAEKCLLEIPDHFIHVEIDYHVIMSNHVHAIIIINDICSGTACRTPTDRHDAKEEFGKPTKKSLSTIIRSYKSAVTKEINIIRNSQGAKIWQRNYYERIIRNEKELHEIRKYIRTNTFKWEIERENIIHNC